jgi:hypothetical protein
MNRKIVFDAFEFDDNCIFNHQVNAIAAIEIDSFVVDGNGTCRWNLTREDGIHGKGIPHKLTQVSRAQVCDALRSPPQSLVQ